MCKLEVMALGVAHINVSTHCLTICSALRGSVSRRGSDAPTIPLADGTYRRLMGRGAGDGGKFNVCGRSRSVVVNRIPRTYLALITRAHNRCTPLIVT